MNIHTSEQFNIFEAGKMEARICSFGYVFPVCTGPNLSKLVPRRFGGKPQQKIHQQNIKKVGHNVIGLSHSFTHLIWAAQATVTIKNVIK